MPDLPDQPVNYDTVQALELRDGDVILPWDVDRDPTLVALQGQLRIIANGITQRLLATTSAGTEEPEHELVVKVLPVGVNLPDERAGEMVYSDPKQHVKIKPRPAR